MNWEKRILHLGLGRFHRGHQAVYYQKMKDLGDGRWGVTSMSMRSPEARDQLKKVKLRYPVLELSAVEVKTSWIESVREVFSAQDDLKKVLKSFCDPQLEIITLTVTEKGYDLDSNGKLDLSKAAMIHDLENPEQPQSAIGLLALGLRERRMSGQNPVTVISCDNLRDNGKKLESAILSYVSALKWSADLLWITEKIKFPNTMVDRIVPALLPEKIRGLEETYKLPSGAELIGTEIFSQWVIEDCFSLPRPEWDKVGVQFVPDVRPFEEMKLKLLNASHSYLAYAGLLRGHQFVHEAIADIELRKNVMKLFEEVSPLLDVPAGFDLAAYKRALIERFENDKLPHQLKQIAMDGAQKLPQRIFPSLIGTEEKGLPNETLILVVREWVRFCKSLLDKGILPEDPDAQSIKETINPRDWKIFSSLKVHSAILDKITN